MQGFVLVLLCVFVFMPAQSARAVFYNDSNVIEVGDGVPPEPSEDDGGAGSDDVGTSAGSEDGGSGSGSSFQGGEASSGGDPSSSGGSEGGGAGGSSESSSSGSSGSSTSGGAEQDVGAGAGGDSGGGTEEELLELLITEGALKGVFGGSSGGVSISGSSGSALDSNDSLGSLGSDSVLSVSVKGSKVREALRGKYDLQDILDGWRAKAGGKYGAREYGLIAASTALRDANVEAVSFTASAFEITYRSRGYLLAVIPWSFPVRVSVIPEALSLEERVKVQLPWYRFFVREFFTADGLRREIDDAIAAARASNTGADTDGTALLFGAVADFLKRKVGTIQDSILLGTPTT